MPFTLAHPAAVLPLRALRHLRTAPLIIGALVPDLPYYMPGEISRHLRGAHQFSGSYTVCLALGLVLLAVVFVLRQPLTALLSSRARWLCLRSLAPFERAPGEWAFAALAIVLGAWTHLAWDSFTHPDGWIVRRVAALSAPLDLLGYHGTVYHELQYLSSGIGLAVLAIWYWRLPQPPAAAAAPHAPRSAVIPVLILAAVAAILIGGVKATENFERTHAVYRTEDIFFRHTLAWFAVLYLLAGTIVTLERVHERATQ